MSFDDLEIKVSKFVYLVVLENKITVFVFVLFDVWNYDILNFEVKKYILFLEIFEKWIF